MDVLLVLFAIVALSLFLVMRFQMNAAAAPFFVIAFAALFLSLSALADGLVFACYLVFLLAAAALVYVFFYKRYPVKEVVARFFRPGMVFFIGASVFLCWILSSRGASFRIWDEYSFWGYAAKTVFETDRLYTFFHSGIPLSYPPALPVFSYFTQFFSDAFCEWKVYFAYDLMIMAVMSLLFSRIRWKNVLSSVVVALFGLIGIYAFFAAMEGQAAYATSYSDMQLGFLFGGALLMWFHSDERNLLRCVSSALPLLLLVFVKDMGFLLALIGAGIMAADLLFSGGYPVKAREGGSFLLKAALSLLPAILSAPVYLWFSRPVGIVLLSASALLFVSALLLRGRPLGKRMTKIGNLLLKWLFILLLFAAILTLYRVWSAHYEALAGSSRDPYLRHTLSEILGGQDAYINKILRAMYDEFFVRQLICFGPINLMCAVFLIVPAAAAVFSKTRRNRLRLIVASVLMCLGFLAYYVFHAYAYIVIFPNSDAANVAFELTSFNRYISTYAIGWMYAVVGLLLFQIGEPFFKNNRLSLSIGTAVAAALIGSIFYFTPSHPDQYLLTSSKVSLQFAGPRPVLIRHAAKYRPALTPEDKIYFFCAGSDSGEWYVANYEFFPAHFMREIGNFIPKDTPESAVGRHEIPFSREDFSGYLLENDVDFVFVYKTDDYFLEEFSPMFTDLLAMAFDDSSRLYHVERQPDGSVMLRPIYNETMLAAIHEAEGGES